MSYILVHWDDSTGDWTLNRASDGTEIAGPWSERPDPEIIYTEMGRDLITQEGVPEALGKVMASDYSFIRESSATPFPWS